MIPAYPTNKYYQKSKEQKRDKDDKFGRLPKWSIQSKRFYLPDFPVILQFLVVPEILYYPNIKNNYNLLLLLFTIINIIIIIININIIRID